MKLILKLNARLQPNDRFDLEDALQEIIATYPLCQKSQIERIA